MTTTTAPTTADYTLVSADPNELDIAANVRDGVDITDDPDFVASIAAHGVLQAVSAVRRADGTLAVHDGQRRTLAAREAGLAAIPVLVRPETAEEKAATIERITEQVISNDHREDLTAGQRAAAVTGLLDLGMSVHQVSSALHIRKDYADKAGRAGRSERARRRLDERQLTLEQAAQLADLEATAESQPWLTDAIENVLANGYGIGYHLQNLARKVAERNAATAAAADYTGRGFTLLHDEPSTTAGDWFSLADLRTPSGDPVAADAPEQAPHLWHVHLYDAGPTWVDKTTREAVEEAEIDFDTEGESDEVAPFEGLRHMNTVEEVPSWGHEFFLRHDRRAEAGLVLAPALAALITDDDEGDGGERDGLSPSQRAAARADAERVEKERAERRKVKALNRAGATATELRRAFLTGLLSGKAAPKNATKWIVTVLAAHGEVFTESKAAERYADIMGAPLREAGQKAEGATVARAEVLLLARVLTAFEARLTGPQDAKDYWRFSTKHYRGMVGIDSYLTFLADIGHTLSPVEQAAMGNITIDAAHTLVQDDA